MSTYRQLNDSTEQLGDISRLAEHLHEDGYLFLRGVLPAERALQVKRDIIAVLQTRNVIENDIGDDPLWSGGPQPTEAEHMRFYDEIVRLDSYNQLAESPEIVSLMEGLLEGPVRVWKQRLIRIIYPDPDSSPAARSTSRRTPTGRRWMKFGVACWRRKVRPWNARSNWLKKSAGESRRQAEWL
jgi:hypothetical protein